MLLMVYVIDVCEICDRETREFDKGNLMPRARHSDLAKELIPFALGYTISRGKLRSEACARSCIHNTHRSLCL